MRDRLWWRQWWRDYRVALVTAAAYLLLLLGVSWWLS